ncbi:MAG: DUF2461 domain-containing protein [Bacteroidota bacterium]
MATKQDILHFLQDLSQHNSKDWMDENRSRYHAAKNRWIEEVETILNRLSVHNPGFAMVQPKDTLSRINNNRRFHPDKPVYKDFFSCEPGGKVRGNSLFYLSVGVSWSFVGGGMHNPEKEQLKAFRSAIDYDGAAFSGILDAPAFQQFYGGLTHFKNNLKSAPKGYSKDHPYIEHLRLQAITATREIRKADFLSDGFVDFIEEAYLAFKPMEDYLFKVMQFEEVV